MIRQAGGELVQPKQRIGVELCLASASNDLAAIKAWHSAGADLSTPDYSGRTALHISSSRGFDQLSEFLCNIGNVNPLIKDCYGRTAIDEALVASEEGRVGEIIAPNFQNILALFKTNEKFND
uniref:ANK_REP_REGION domain-containing protein n=1 Tax=Meloidogyne javanica TaxID=6303 RepID=A0A915LMD8_MELJA